MSTEKFLTFNRASYENVAGGEEGGKAYSFPAWTLWEKPVSSHPSSNDHDHYSTATRCLSRINNIEEFWKYWLCVPQPSELLEGKHFVREVGTDGGLTQVDTLMLFREGVRPEWEDVANASGGHFQYMFKPNSVVPAQLDEYWNNIAVGLVGGMVEPAEMITGIRLLDKSTSGRNSCIRIEIWFKDFSKTDKINQLRSSIEACMCRRLDGSMGPVPKPELKSHSS